MEGQFSSENDDFVGDLIIEVALPQQMPHSITASSITSSTDKHIINHMAPLALKKITTQEVSSHIDDVTVSPSVLSPVVTVASPQLSPRLSPRSAAMNSDAYETMRKRFSHITKLIDEDSDDEEEAGVSDVGDSPRTPVITNRRFSSFEKSFSGKQRGSMKQRPSILRPTSGSSSKKAWNKLQATVNSSVNKDVIEEVALDTMAAAAASACDDITLDFWRDTSVPKPDTPTDFNDVLLSGDEKENESGNDLLNIILKDIPNYPAEFELESKSASLLVSKVPAEVVLAQHRAIKEQDFHDKQVMADLVMKKEVDFMYRERIARNRVIQLEKLAQERLAEEKQKSLDAFDKREHMLNRQFRIAKERLESDLAAKQATLREVYGEVVRGGDSLSRAYKMDWDDCPQPVEVYVHQLRAVKDKLPKGAYVLMLTQYDRLGGQPLAWSRIGAYGIGSERPATTRPVKHYGRYFDRLLKIDSSAFALCPPRSMWKPSYVFIIELFQLATYHSPLDRVVAWTALPMCNEHFNIVSGRFRLPLLRGEHGVAVQSYKSMESIVGNNLGAWLCNLYIEVRLLPRYILDKKSNAAVSEYDIGFNFMNKLLNLNPLTRGNAAAGNQLPARKLDKDPSLKFISENKKDITQEDEAYIYAVMNRTDTGLFHRKISTSQKKQIGSLSAKDAVDSDSHAEQSVLDGDGAGPSKLVYERGYDRGEEMFLHDSQKGKLAGQEVFEDSADRLWSSAGLEGATVRRRQHDGSRFDSEALSETHLAAGAEDDASSLHGGSLQGGAGGAGAGAGTGGTADRHTSMWWTELKSSKDYDQFSISLCPVVAQKTHLLPNAIVKSKLKFLLLEALGDLSFEKFGTFDFSASLFVVILSFWLRMYVHFIAQFLYLQALATPVYGFEMRLYEVMFKFMANTLPVVHIVGIVWVGPIANIVVFAICIYFSHLFYKYAGSLPESVSKFVAFFGIATLLDPLLIFLVDVAMHNYDCGSKDAVCKVNYTDSACSCFTGDFVKLWSRMLEDENSGLTGLLITVMLYFMTAVVSLMLNYSFMVYIYKDARILDLWRRLSAPTEEFFVPHDFEVKHMGNYSIN